jgi:hypothetical protein
MSGFSAAAAPAPGNEVPNDCFGDGDKARCFSAVQNVAIGTGLHFGKQRGFSPSGHRELGHRPAD